MIHASMTQFFNKKLTVLKLKLLKPAFEDDEIMPLRLRLFSFIVIHWKAFMEIWQGYIKAQPIRFFRHTCPGQYWPSSIKVDVTVIIVWICTRY